METAENIMRIHQTIYGKGSGCCILFTQPFTLAFQKSFINFLIQQSGWFKVAWNKNQKGISVIISHAIIAGNMHAIMLKDIHCKKNFASEPEIELRTRKFSMRLDSLCNYDVPKKMKN